MKVTVGLLQPADLNCDSLIGASPLVVLGGIDA
jgi:hypothetical protein